MPDLNEFYAFKMTSSSDGTNRGKNSNSNNDETGCSSATIVLCTIIFALYLIGKISGKYFSKSTMCYLV